MMNEEEILKIKHEKSAKILFLMPLGIEFWSLIQLNITFASNNLLDYKYLKPTNCVSITYIRLFFLSINLQL